VIGKPLHAQSPGQRPVTSGLAVAAADIHPPLFAGQQRHRPRLQEGLSTMSALVDQHLHQHAQVVHRDAQAPLRPEQRAVAADHVVRQTRGLRRRLLAKIIGLHHPRAGRVPDLTFALGTALAIGVRCRLVGGGKVRGLAAAAQAQWMQHQSLHQAVETLAGGALHHGGDDAEVQVDVFEVMARCPVALPVQAVAVQPPLRLQHVLQRGAAVEEVAFATVRQPGPVRQQQPQCDRHGGELRVAQCPAQLDADVFIEVDPTLFQQPHHTHRDHQLADRGDAVQRAIGDRQHGACTGPAEVADAEGVGVDHLAVADGQRRHGHDGVL
jgi:hypothetical protein